MKHVRVRLILAGILVLLATQCALPQLTNEAPELDGDGDGEPLGGAPNAWAGTGGEGSPPECEEEETRCLDERTPERCNAEGEWSSLEPCMGDTPVCNEVTGACAACDPGASKRCKDAVTLQKCNAEGEWENEEFCRGSTPVCVEEEAACGVCEPDAVGCEENAPAVCKSDGSGHNVGAACSGENPACLAETGTCGTCQEGAHQCSGNESFTCLESGAWGPGTPCEGATPVCAAGTGECEECDPLLGTGKSCDGNTPRTCVDYKWVPQAEDCATDSPDLPICENATGECVCDEGTFRCATSSGRQRCISGVWQTATSCIFDTPHCLEEDGSCVSCLRNSDCSPTNDCVTSSCAASTTHTCSETPKTPAGSHRCDFISTDDGYCDGEGTCVECSTNAHCPHPSGNSRETLCRDNACVDPVHYVGWSYPGTTAIATNTAASPDAVYWFQLPALSRSATLTKFGAHGSGGGVSLKMALYADGGTEPGSVLAETDAPLALFNGYPEIAASGSVELTAGERYWIAVKVSAHTTSLRRAARSSARGWVDDATYGDTSWPAFNIDSASDVNDEDWGIYIQVEDTE